MNKTAIAIHGGAGTILRRRMTPEMETEYRQALEKALETGWKILENYGSAIDAVERAVAVLEDEPLFNAGRGAVFTHEGEIELDAAIMDGQTLNAGAVAFVKNVKNPVKLARMVMEKTEHVFLAGQGANRFAREMNAEFETDEYFFTELRYEQLLEARRENRVQLDHSPNEQGILQETEPQLEEKKFGTVGAVACDAEGNLAAATSTGGMTNKKFGRVGDTPLIGAGTYADNATCAVSCTGHGEFFIVSSAAYDVAARMKYANLDLAEAARATIEHLRNIGGEGGLIAVNARGNVALPFNSEGMYRGYANSDGEFVIEIYRD